MTREEIFEELENRGFDPYKTYLFESPSYYDAIIGVTTKGNVCYSFDRMVDSLVKDDNMGEDEAVEFIEYNTIRALDYYSATDGYPIIVYCA